MRHYVVSTEIVPSMHMDASVPAPVSSSASPPPDPGWCSLAGMFPCGLPGLPVWGEWWLLDIPNKLK